MPSPRQRFGMRAEDQAEQFLLTKGFIILDRHVTSRFGEIDILAQDGETIVAVEVKARRSKKFGTAAEGVTEKKLQNLSAALHDALSKRDWTNRAVRIDVITVEPEGIGHVIGVGPE